MNNLVEVPYSEARKSIENGDIVFMAGDKSLIGKIIALVTKSDIYHVGIACWMQAPNGKDILCSVEQWYGGRRIVNLAHYAYGSKLYVVKNPVQRFSSYMDELIENTGSAYGNVDFINAGVYDLFGIKSKNRNGEICSEMIMRIINRHLNTNKYTVISPARLFKVITEDFGMVVKMVVK